MPLAGGAVLRVDFDRAHDRWKHRVSLDLPAGSSLVSPVLLFESSEGTSEDDWPISPPLQFVSIETRPKKLPVALLMGMAGGSHWSASIEQHPAEQMLRFDIACRAGSRPEQLGSRYRFGPRVELMNAEEGPDRVRFLAGGLAFEISGEQGKDFPLPAITLDDRELRIHFGEPTTDQRQTYRWLYRLAATGVAE
jgi:hypothetical protein